LSWLLFRMRTSRPESLLPGLLLALCAFVVLWCASVAILSVSGLYLGWFHLFARRWYEDPTIGLLSIALATLFFRIAFRRLRSKPNGGSTMAARPPEPTV
jgi:hypothetical protein